MSKMYFVQVPTTRPSGKVTVQSMNSPFIALPSKTMRLVHEVRTAVNALKKV